jgi:hypothetical protein
MARSWDRSHDDPYGVGMRWRVVTTGQLVRARNSAIRSARFGKIDRKGVPHDVQVDLGITVNGPVTHSRDRRLNITEATPVIVHNATASSST